jgi:hypothetical protein
MAWLTLMSMVKCLVSIAFVAIAFGIAGVFAMVTPLGGLPVARVVVRPLHGFGAQPRTTAEDAAAVSGRAA